MIIIKTKMTEIPTSRKECSISLKSYGNIGCPILRDWLEPFQYKNDKVKLDNCPLEKV